MRGGLPSAVYKEVFAGEFRVAGEVDPEFAETGLIAR